MDLFPLFDPSVGIGVLAVYGLVAFAFTYYLNFLLTFIVIVV